MELSYLFMKPVTAPSSSSILPLQRPQQLLFLGEERRCLCRTGREVHLLLRLHRVRMLQLRGAVLLLLVSAVLSSRELSEAGSGSVVSEAGSGSVVSEAGSPPPPSPEPSSGNTGADGIVASTPVYQTALDQLYAQVDLNPTC